jgi:uncharacterized lipoprotein YddW (UPF0748 family)
MRPFAVLLLVMLAASPTFTQRPPAAEREFRAAWIATVNNIDFPSKRTLTIDEQKAELVRDLDLASRLNLNAVIFQVRPMADALYHSELEPWSEYLTGEMGKPQAFDPLEFIVAEAHKRGILVHAWFNPYRAYHPSAKTISADHISKRRPELAVKYGKYLWLDPTDPEAIKHSLDVIRDVVRRYDIDGVHFDDYFYPYIEKDENGNDIEFPDDRNWRMYQKASAGGKQVTLSRGDWRRLQVNNFIQTVGREVKRIKPDVMFGISPFGIWKPLPDLGIEGFNAYEGLYADSRKWLQEGWVDYFSPQLYWETARTAQSFPVLLKWWNEQNVKSRHIWPGLASYRIGRNENWPVTELTNQIKGIRASKSTAGEIYFNFKSLRNDQGGVQKELRENAYRRKAIIPVSPWIKSRKPPSPKFTINRGSKLITAKWQPVRNAFWYLVYAKDKTGWSYSILPSSERSISLSSDRRIEGIVVKSVDRLGNISN